MYTICVLYRLLEIHVKELEFFFKISPPTEKWYRTVYVLFIFIFFGVSRNYHHCPSPTPTVVRARRRLSFETIFKTSRLMAINKCKLAVELPPSCSSPTTVFQIELEFRNVGFFFICVERGLSGLENLARWGVWPHALFLLVCLADLDWFIS